MLFDPQDFRILCRVLKELEYFSSAEWSRIKQIKKDEDKHLAFDNHETLSGMYPSISRGKLRKIAHESTRAPRFVLDESLYLPPIYGDNSEFVPVLNIQCDFNRPKICYRLGMIKYVRTKKMDRARGFGFRFECEHLTSIHGYPHMQVTTQPLTIPFQKSPSWIPQNVPCIPLPAQDVVSLLLCVIISLYGSKRSGKMIKDLKIAEKYKQPIKNILPDL